MASADFSYAFSLHCCINSLCFFFWRRHMRSPGVMRLSFYWSLLDIPLCLPCDILASLSIARLPLHIGLLSTSCSSGPVFALQLPSDSASRQTPLLVTNGSYHKGPFRTFTLWRRAVPGARQRGALLRAPLFFALTTTVSAAKESGSKIYYLTKPAHHYIFHTEIYN